MKMKAFSELLMVDEGRVAAMMFVEDFCLFFFRVKVQTFGEYPG